MATNDEVIKCGNKSLPRSLDVNVSVTQAQTEIATDLTLAVCVVKDGPLPIGAGRVRFYSDFDSVSNDFGPESEAANAARDFTSQTPRPLIFAIGQAFDTPQKGFMTTGASGELAAFKAISDGEFSISVDAVTSDITGLDFTSATSFDDVAATTQTAVDAVFSGATVVYNGASFVFTSPTSGDSSSVSVLASPLVVSGMDVSGPVYFNGLFGEANTQEGYTPTGITQELQLIQMAAGCSGRFIYGWTLEEGFRDSQDVLDAAAYLETQDKAAFFPCSNDPLALDPNATTDIGPELDEFGYLKTSDPIYHDNQKYYPDFALAAIMLAVDYSGVNTTITAKFKNLLGIPTVGLSVTQYTTLQGKHYNTFSLTGNNSRVFREGTQVAAGWFIDDQINVDNLKEELQVAAYNAFLRNGKVPLTVGGQAIMEDSLTPTGERYTDNGSIADRQVVDLSSKSGFSLEPAYSITSGNIALLTASDRAVRKAPPMVFTVYLAGAMHSIDININVIS